MDKKSPSFPLSYESDGVMGKRSPKKPPTTKKEMKPFFNTTPSSE
ncbi:hypothetical protein [Anoxybacteroides amylolyticum]|uniref:Uncharacterized protein n=1 Tax=Anoxybacteroides amylolyticum TaxID=294699 RepID=A0A160F738_9BACL|nr:hypothetical protein [Anoxybacillus amylolyticus]ANB61845.1 hypothetical protein GFC30_1848 [Anoxybacillus amylolyticus]